MPTRELTLILAAIMYPQAVSVGYQTDAAIEHSLTLAESLQTRFDARQVARAQAAQAAAAHAAQLAAASASLTHAPHVPE